MTGIINGEFSIRIPEGFRKMTGDQLKKFYSVTENLYGWRSGDGSMINVGYAPGRKPLSLLLKPGDVIKNYDKTYSKRFPDYENTGVYPREAAGEKGFSMSFNYTAKHENVPVMSELTVIKATPHNPRLAPLYVICLHIFRHSTQIFLAGRQPACVKFMHSDEKSQLNFVELACDLTHRGCAVLPKA